MTSGLGTHSADHALVQFACHRGTRRVPLGAERLTAGKHTR